ncbi:MAG: RHS repeat-associated core domain-containing protein, partial [Lachnospiraceae bacterium]
ETLISTEGTYVAAETVYDPKYGNVIETKDANGISTTYEYDNLGRVTRIRYPSYQEYEGIRYLREDITYTDSSAYNGRYYYLVTSKCYESTEGDSVSTANRVSFAYTHFDDNGNVVKEQNDIGTQTYQYDNANRLESYKDLGDTANDNTEHEVPFTYRYSYDLFGNLITITDRHGSTYEIDYKSLSTEYCFNPYDSDTNENYYVVNYDMYGNTISESTYPNGRDAAPLTTTYTYDLHGNQLSVTDANDKTTTYEYDKLGQAVKAMQPDGSVIRNQYNKWGKAANVIRDGEEERSQISYTYNDRGLESGIRQKGRDIESPAWQYQYNAKGLLASIEEPSGNQVSYAYDHSDRVTYKKAGSKEYDYCYNFRGQLIETNEFVNHTKTSKYKLYLYYQDGKILYSEDEYGLLAYNYTKRGNVTYLGGSPESRNYTRNTEDRLVQLTSLNQSLSYDYYANGLVKSITYPNTSIVTNYTYDDIGRLLRLKTTKGTRVIRDYQYTYDGVGNILTITGSENVTYTYDDLYRLKTYTKNGVTTTYEYGDRNNLTAERQTNSDGDTISYITYTYTGDNRLKSKTSGEESIVYQYDLNGNLISDSTGNQYWYDEENKLVKSKVDEVVTTYDNGLDGYRHKKQSGDTTTKYYVDIYGRVAQEQIGSQKVQIIWDDSRPVARVVDDTWYYYLWNAHGDIVGLLDENGNEVNTYEYDPWGKVETANETIPNPIRYAGEYYDEEVEFIYLRARYYSPNERRFTQEDPARDELDWYVYCGNNPVMFVDSSGLKDYIYTSRDEYYIENDKGKCEFLCIDRYYIEIDGSRYRANSKETVTLYDWNKIDMEFTSKTLKRLVNKANLKKTTAKRIMKESVGGDLDFKLQLNESTLYLSDGVVYNRNEAGNFIWAYFLESKKVSGYISGALAQGGSIATPLLNKNGTPRFDESWDVRARWMGVRYYYESNNKLWLFRILYGDKYRFHDIK